MASKKANVKVQGPYDTAANWSSSTRILLKGEKVYAKVDSGAVRSKTGDGAKTFRQLPYDDEAVYQGLSSKVSVKVSSAQPTGQTTNDIWYKTL